MTINDQPCNTIGEREGRAKGWLIFGGSLLGGFLSIFTIWFFFTDATTGFLESSLGIFFSEPRSALSQKETLLLQQMIENGAVLTPSEVMSEVSSFYERVITILTTLIAFLGVIAYMYVRTVSEESALKTVREAVVNQIDSDAHKQDVEQSVKSVVEPELKKHLYPKIDGLDAYLKDLDAKIAELEKARKDMPSDEVITDIYERIGMISKHISLEDEEESDDSGSELDLG